MVCSKANESNALYNETFCFLKTNNFLYDYFLFSKHASKIVEEIIVVKFNVKKKFIKFFKFKWVFLIIAFLLLAGAIGKYFININNCVNSFREIIFIDEAILNKFKR